VCCLTRYIPVHQCKDPVPTALGTRLLNQAMGSVDKKVIPSVADRTMTSCLCPYHSLVPWDMLRAKRCPFQLCHVCCSIHQAVHPAHAEHCVKHSVSQIHIGRTLRELQVVCESLPPHTESWTVLTAHVDVLRCLYQGFQIPRWISLPWDTIMSFTRHGFKVEDGVEHGAECHRLYFSFVLACQFNKKTFLSRHWTLLPL